jgi:hypothetical protein
LELSAQGAAYFSPHYSIAACRRWLILGSRLFLSVEEVARRHLKGQRDSCDVEHGEIAKAPLDAGHVRPVDVRQVGKRLLRESLLPPQAADGRPELTEDRMGSFGHDQIIARYSGN